jgi:xanthine dehydrogenase small subunit
MKNQDLISIEPGEREYQMNRISFWLNGREMVADIPPARTTLEFLNQQLGMYGTKCSCNEGDCGACTVVVAHCRDGGVVYEAVTSCLYNAAKLHGKHLITVEGLGTPDSLHPIQQALLEFHGTQCGYCTPGFVMSLFALLAMTEKPSREQILAALEGNLCRCTGYDSILNAAEWLSENYLPDQIVPVWCRELEPKLREFGRKQEYKTVKDASLYPCSGYYLPASREEVLGLLEENDGAILINGGSDVMVQMNIQRRHYPVLVDLSGVKGMDGIGIGFGDGYIRIGANATYSRLMESDPVKAGLPALIEMIRQIASRQIRNFGTLAGNIANASPIGDTLPLLLVLGAELELTGSGGTRQVPLSGFFLSYRKTALNKGEFISAVLIPPQPEGAFVRVSKATKRRAVDISSVASAVLISQREGRISSAQLAFGGVAEIPKLSIKFLQAMLNMELGGLHPEAIADFVQKEFEPISDVRGSRDYRRQVIHNQVLKYLLEFLQGEGL